MRIAYVVTQFPPSVRSGMGRYAEEIAPHLAQRHELTVHTLNDGRQPVSEQRDGLWLHRPLGRLLGAGLRRWGLDPARPAGFGLLAAHVLVSSWRYLRWLRRDRPDLVVLHDATNFLCGLACHYLLRLPVVLHVHTTEHRTAERRRMRPALGVLAGVERWLGRIARRVVVAADEMREHLVAAGWDRERIDVVPLGGSFERVLADPALDRDGLRAGAAARRERLGISAGEPVLLFAGRLVPHKGIFDLLEAVPEIAAAVPGLRLVVVGDGDLAGVRRAIAEHGLDGRVVLSDGWVTGRDLLEYYELADACVFPSSFEPFGLVATEAMALGKPTILGAGFPRVFVGDPDRPAASYVEDGRIADAVVEVMTDPALRAALGERAEQLVRDRLSWSRTAEETLAVYSEVAVDC